ncbi:MAG: ATP synthase F1 subunit delta [Deltaproteobacteria bacterium]|nr:ATP synthase F1 subunit delta [Deltaproteobacteria bacterium]
MIDSSVARRYARALFALEADTPARTHDARLEDLEQFAAALDESEELRQTLLGPGLTMEQRQALVDTLARKMRLAKEVQSFLHVLAERSRLGIVPSVAAAYRELADAQNGRVRATVVSAAAISEGEVEKLEKTFSTATHKKVVLSAKTDPALIGGLLAEVGGTRYDGTLKTQLEKLREELLK